MKKKNSLKLCFWSLTWIKWKSLERKYLSWKEKERWRQNLISTTMTFMAAQWASLRLRHACHIVVKRREKEKFSSDDGEPHWGHSKFSTVIRPCLQRWQMTFKLLYRRAPPSDSFYSSGVCFQYLFTLHSTTSVFSHVGLNCYTETKLLFCRQSPACQRALKSDEEKNVKLNAEGEWESSSSRVTSPVKACL